MLMLLKKQFEFLKGMICFIFQLVEEKGGGVLKMIEEGVFDDVDYLYGVYICLIQEMQNGCCVLFILYGLSQYIEGMIIGEEVYGVCLYFGKNSIEIVVFFVYKFGFIYIDLKILYIVKMIKF